MRTIGILVLCALIGSAKAQSAQEQAAIKTIRGFGALVDSEQIDQAFSLYVSPAFTDHSELARATMHKSHVGYHDVLAFFKMMMRPGHPALVQKLTADDDMVTVQGFLGQDIFRVENGKMTDHWDSLGSNPGVLARADQ